MAGLTPELTTELRTTLLECDELYNFPQLRSVFATNKLRPFRNRLKQASSGQAQADLLISDLFESKLKTGENGLVLFIRELATRYKDQQLEGDLLSLADRVEAVLEGKNAPSGSIQNEPDAPDQSPSFGYRATELSQLRDMSPARERPESPQRQDPQPAPVARGQHLRIAEESTNKRSPQAEIKNRFALLIGVGKYSHSSSYSPLPHTIKDVKELNRLLSQAGYTTRLLHSEQDDPNLQPTENNIWGELENLVKKTGPGDLLLVHYGGHGVLRDGVAYLTVQDTRSTALKRTAIDLDEFRSVLEDASAQACILILDACHAGMGRSVTGMDPDFEKHVYLQAEGTATLASCKQNQLAYEYEETGHGAFTYFLLDGLKGGARQPHKRFITFQDISNYITDKMKRWCISKGLDQHPNSRSELVGDPALIVLDVEVPDPANPFGVTLAIKEPEKFIGRTAILRRLLNMLQHSSIALIGEPKIGKSSLLWQLKQRWPGKVLGPIDFHLHDRDDFYAILGEDALLTNQDRRIVRDHLLQEDALILIDELGYAPQQGICLDDMKLLRAICNANHALHIVAASRVEPKEVLPDPDTGPGDSPWYNFLPIETLGPLNDKEARHLLQAPWHKPPVQFDAEAIEEMLTLTQNHPCWLQQAAFHRFESTVQPEYEWLARYQTSVNALRHD